MISAVLLDLYETLITESGIPPARAASLGPRLGLEQDAYRRKWKARRPGILRGQMSFADALIEISQQLSGRVDLEIVRDICQQRVRDKAAAYAQVHEDVAFLVSTLGRRGIRLAVVSNGFEEDVVGWPDWRLAKMFRCTVFSCAEGVAKPDPEIYRLALDRLQVDPSAALYIGDGADDELAGAERAGLRVGRAAWFVRDSPLKGTCPELRDAEDLLKLIADG